MESPLRRRRPGDSFHGQALGAALLCWLLPGTAHALPPQALVIAGSSLVLPIIALLVTLWYFVKYWLHHFRNPPGPRKARVFIVFAVLALFITLCSWTLSQVTGPPGGAPELVDLSPESSLYIDAESLTTEGTPDVLLIDLRPRFDFRRSHLVGAKNIPLPSQLSWKPQYLDPQLQFEASVVAAFHRASTVEDREVVLYCWKGLTSRWVAESLRERGIEVWALLDGWDGAKHVLPTAAGTDEGVLSPRRLSWKTAQRLQDAGRIRVVSLGPKTLFSWVQAGGGGIPSWNREGSEELPLVLEPQNPWEIDPGDSFLRLVGHTPFAWIDRDFSERGESLDALSWACVRAEDLVGPAWWLLLVLLCVVWTVHSRIGDLRRALRGERSSSLGWVPLLGQAVVIGFLAMVAPNVEAFFPDRYFYLVMPLPGRLPLLLPTALGVWLILGRSRAWKAGRFTALLRRRFRPDTDGTTGKRVFRWQRPLLGLAISAALMPGPLIVLYAVLVFIWTPIVLEGIFVFLCFRHVTAPAEDDKAVRRLLRIAGLRMAESADHEVEVRTYRPGSPGHLEVIHHDEAVAVGVFSKRPIDPDAQLPTLWRSEEFPTTNVGEAVSQSVAAANVVGWDLELEWRLEPRPAITKVELAKAPAEAERATEYLLHRQLMDLAAAAALFPSYDEPVLSATRYEEAVTRPTPLTFDSLRCRSGGDGAALASGGRFGIRPNATVVVRIGTRIYDLVGNPTPPAFNWMLRMTVRGWLLGGASADARRFLHRVSDLFAIGVSPSPSPRRLMRTLFTLHGKDALFSERVSLACAVAASEVQRRGDIGASNAYSGKRAFPHVREIKEVLESPYELMPSTVEGTPSALTLELLPIPRIGAMADAIRETTKWPNLWHFAEELRTWSRPFAIARIAFVGNALLQFGRSIGWDEDIFYLQLSEVQSLLRGRPVPRKRVRARREALALLGRIDLPDELSLADLESLTVLASDAPEVPAPESHGPVQGTVVSGVFPLCGVVQVLPEVGGGSTDEGAIVVTQHLSASKVLACTNASAVVVERGGLLSHAAIQAREVGLPAIFGARQAIANLRDGELVRIDTDGSIRQVADCAEHPGMPDEPDAPLWFPLTMARDPKAVGQKAATLARLLEHSVPVPRGAAIPMEVFRTTTSSLGIPMPAFGRAGTAPTNLTEGHLPPAVKNALTDMWTSLVGANAEPHLIVRSSGLHEDGRDHSFAGLFESVAEVRDLPGALNAVCRCWRSAWSPALHDYAGRHGLIGEVDMGLVVQHYQQALFGGVLFTRDPIGNRLSGELMICEMARDGAAPVTDGGARPTRLILDRDTGALEGHDTDDLLPGQLSVLASRLIETGHKIETLLGGPADIEWLWDGDRLWVVQARRLTV